MAQLFVGEEGLAESSGLDANIFIQSRSSPLSMANLNVAVLGELGYSESLGKKGTSTDITFYNLKKGDATVTFIEPSKYPERLAPLFYAVSTARRAILVIGDITPIFGEIVVMLHSIGLESGFIVLKNFMPRERVIPLIKGTVVEKYEFVEDNPNDLRARLLGETERLGSEAPSPAQTQGTVLIDHSFNVKGVGTVALGCVSSGSIHVHENLSVLPGGKSAFIRSIQKHDDDFDWAIEGDRVGLAIKDVAVEDLERGTVLTSGGSIRSSLTVNADAELVKYWTNPLKTSMVLHLGHWMQFLPARVESIEDAGDWRRASLSLKLEKPLAYLPGDRAVLAYLEGGKLRVAGAAKLN
jgi:selenocysteine-specific translation elongation factor